MPQYVKILFSYNVLCVFIKTRLIFEQETPLTVCFNENESEKTIQSLKGGFIFTHTFAVEKLYFSACFTASLLSLNAGLLMFLRGNKAYLILVRVNRLSLKGLAAPETKVIQLTSNRNCWETQLAKSLFN